MLIVCSSTAYAAIAMGVSDSWVVCVLLKECYFQVDNIAPMFELHSTQPAWIVCKNGNIAVWPRSGLFSGPLVVAGAMYEGTWT